MYLNIKQSNVNSIQVVIRRLQGGTLQLENVKNVHGEYHIFHNKINALLAQKVQLEMVLKDNV